MSRDRISDVRAFIVGGARWGWVVVKIETEQGWHGVGEASLEGREATIACAVGELRRYLIGKDPEQISLHHHALYREPVWSGGPILQCAISGIDTALWDLKAKRREIPLYELLGGRFRGPLRMYANAWWYGGGTPDDVADAALAQIERGYTGVKFNPFNRQPDTDPFHLSSKVLATGVEYVAAVREAIGSEAELYIDFNAVLLNAGDAVRAVRALQPFHPAFIEEPLAQENHRALAELKHRVDVPIATGERLFSFYEFENLIAASAADVIQPDLAHCGGITAAMKIASRAEMAYLPIAPHNPNGPICEAASAHLATVIPNFGVLEHFPGESWRAEVVGEPYSIEGGVLTLAEKPGLGIDFDEMAAQAHPFESKDLADFHVRNYTGRAS